jgi:molybdopterin-guanine dinucleotide biosynthesis protein B
METLRYDYLGVEAGAEDITALPQLGDMGAPRAVAIVGFKAAGKTRVIEAIIAELTRRGYRVGTLKHTVEDQLLDKVGTDTWRHAEAGAVSSAILSDNRTAIFLKRAMNLQRAADTLGEVDFIIMEGFKALDIAPRIIVPRTQDEVTNLTTGLEIAAVDVEGKTLDTGALPLIKLNDAAALTNIVEKQAYPLLAGLNCKACGSPTCRELGKTILAGQGKAENCVKYSHEVLLRADGSIIPLNKFTGSALANVILGFMKTLKGSEVPHRVELEFEVREDT